MTRTSGDSPHRPGDPSRPTRAERLIVPGGFALAAIWTAAALATGAGAEAIGPLWLAALAWTALASLACALRRGIRDRDWSVFRCFRFTEDDGETDEFASRTGRYQWLGDQEDRLLRNNDWLR